MKRETESTTVVCGVMPAQRDVVMVTAADIARRIGGNLVLVYADQSMQGVQGGAASTIDPDIADDGMKAGELARSLAERAARVLAHDEISWSFAVEPGTPAQVLSHAAEREDAACIVIGSREPGLKAVVREVVSGKVSQALSQSQHRPIVIVPQHSDSREMQ